MMVGGPPKAVERLAPILDVLAPETNEQSRAAIGPRGWLRFGPSGAGHYVKMVHNGVEYGLMQAYAEGFDLFDKCEYELDNAKIAHLWGQGSVVRSWLCELAARAFEADGNDLAGDRGLHRGLRRGPLDDRGRDRPRRADAGDHRLAVRALALARQRRLRRPRAGGAAQPVRRPRGQERPRPRPRPGAPPARPVLDAEAAERGGRGRSPNRSDRAREPAHRRPRAPAGRADDARHLRRHRRPGQAQTAAGALQPRPRGRAARALPPGRRLAQRRKRTRTTAPSARRRSAASRGARPTRTCSRACSRTSSTCPGTFDDDSVYAELGKVLDEFEKQAGRAPEPRLLPVDRARASSR